MKFEIDLPGAGSPVKRTIELEKSGESWRVCLNGQPVDADVAFVAPHTLSILLFGRSFEVRITEQPDAMLKIHVDGR